MLHERLLGILRGDAAEISRGHFHFDFVAKNGIGLDPPGVEDRDLIMFGEDLFGDDQLGVSADIAGLLVYFTAQFTGRADRLLRRR